jgi:hypothetical protein
VSRLANLIIGVIKWPCAILSILFLPSALLTSWLVLDSLYKTPGEAIAFIIAFVAYSVFWFLFLRQARGGWFSTLEHELTHAFFALLSFHKVHSIKATQDEGGYVQYSGGGNWLISISPYFFPTFSFILAIALFFANPSNLLFTNALLGLSLSYHACSSIHDLHGQQTDLQSVGFPFAWTFLPGANVVCYTTIIGFAHGGVDRAQEYISFVVKNTFNLAGKFIG